VEQDKKAWGDMKPNPRQTDREDFVYPVKTNCNKSWDIIPPGKPIYTSTVSG